ncbi:MAG: QcrA and Rieske domain-containing protein [Limisphaerales bacterium]
MKTVSRREVIKTLALGMAFSSSVGKSWASTHLLEVQQAAVFSAGILRINLNDFPALAQPYGSVRIGTSPIGPDRQTDAWLKPILINRGAADDLHVLSAVCTHQGCILPRMDSTSRVMPCFAPCGHGSLFELDGTVREGPANSALDRYQYTQVGSVLTIAVPDLFFDVTLDRAPASTRVQIRFVAFYEMTYEVYFRASLDGPAQRVSFALTENGAANLQAIEGDFDSTYVTLYLDKPGTFGFFQVAVKTTEV